LIMISVMLKRNCRKQQMKLSHGLRQSEGMDIIVSKTKVMFFGGHGEKLNFVIKDTLVDNVNRYKYLGVFLDSELNFTMQTDYAAD